MAVVIDCNIDGTLEEKSEPSYLLYRAHGIVKASYSDDVYVDGIPRTGKSVGVYLTHYWYPLNSG